MTFLLARSCWEEGSFFLTLGRAAFWLCALSPEQYLWDQHWVAEQQQLSYGEARKCWEVSSSLLITIEVQQVFHTETRRGEDTGQLRLLEDPAFHYADWKAMTAVVVGLDLEIRSHIMLKNMESQRKSGDRAANLSRRAPFQPLQSRMTI